MLTCDEVQINGSLKKGFGNFAGVMYNAKIESVVSPEPGDVARKIRDWFADAVRQNISEPEVSLGLGFLVGQRRALPASLVSALQTVGLTHVVVASGYNLTILVRITRRLFAKISKYLAVLTAGLMVLGFIAITGLSPSMSRAGW
jgi:competence protein ComEC